MKVNFFEQSYQREQPRKDPVFGINDGVQLNGEDGIAYTTTDDAEKPWNAVVDNKDCFEVQFMPLDHNIIIHPVSSETYSLCDGMLFRGQEWLAFVELKVQRSNWVQHNIEQLESAIKLFCENHDYRTFKIREAYAANRRFPSYHFSHKIQMNEFHGRTKFRLHIQNAIQVK